MLIDGVSMNALKMEAEVKPNARIIGMTYHELEEQCDVYITAITRKVKTGIKKDNPSQEIKENDKINAYDKIEFKGENVNVINAYRKCIEL